MPDTGLTPSAVSTVLGPQLDQIDQQMRTLLTSFDGSEMSSQDLLKMQMQVQNLETVTGLHTTIVKALGDLIKDIVQKTS